MVTINPTQIETLRQQRDAEAKAGDHAKALQLNDAIGALKIAKLKVEIAAKYCVDEYDDCGWAVFETAGDRDPASDNEHDDPLDAEAEMESIIQDEVKAAIAAEEFE